MVAPYIINSLEVTSVNVAEVLSRGIVNSNTSAGAGSNFTTQSGTVNAAYGVNGPGTTNDFGAANAAYLFAGATATGGMAITASAGLLQFRTGAARTLRFAINGNGAVGLGNAPSYGNAGQIMTSAGSTAPPTWQDLAVDWSAVNNKPAFGTVSLLNTNGSTTQYLRGDGTWATPPGGGGGTPGGSSGQVQWNDGGAFAGADLVVDASDPSQTQLYPATRAGTGKGLLIGAGESTDGTGGTTTVTAGPGAGTGGALILAGGEGSGAGLGGFLALYTTPDTPANYAARLTVSRQGAWGLGPTQNYGAAGQSLLSGGPSADPTWGIPAPVVQSLATTVLITPAANTDMVDVTALAANASFAAPAGSPANGQGLVIRIKDNGTARSIGFNGIYREIGASLPTTTVAGKTMYLGFIYNSAGPKWDLISVAQQP